MKRILTIVIPFVILILVSINTVFAVSPIVEIVQLTIMHGKNKT